jgi:hypothetical protein
MGVGTNTLGLGLGQEAGPAVTLAQIPQMQQQQLGVGMVQPQLMTTGVSTAATVMPDYGLAALGSLGVNTGGVGALGAGGIALGSGNTGGTSKKTTVAQPIYAQSVRNTQAHTLLSAFFDRRFPLLCSSLTLLLFSFSVARWLLCALLLFERWSCPRSSRSPFNDRISVKQHKTMSTGRRQWTVL